MNEIRKFEKADWYAYAGAERFSKNSEPLILDIELDHNAEATVIADKNGIQFFIGNSENVEAWTKEVQLTSLRAEGELRAIQKALEGLTYAPDVAYRLDHGFSKDDVFYGFTSIGELY